MNKLTDLSADILAKLSGSSPESVDFPAQVCCVLEDIPSIVLSDAVDYLEFLLQNSNSGLSSLNNNFGQPNLTLGQNDRLLVELIHWPSQLTAVHCHNFQGGFKVLQGERLHLEYNWTQHGETQCGLAYGNLDIINRQLLHENSIHPIKHNEDFIHCLAGVTCPCLTLVVRSRNAEPPKSYFPSGIAIFDDAIADRLSIQVAALQNLRILSEERSQARLIEWIQNATPSEVFVLCMRLGIVPSSHVVDRNNQISEIPGLSEKICQSIKFELDLINKQATLRGIICPEERAKLFKALFRFEST